MTVGGINDLIDATLSDTATVLQGIARIDTFEVLENLVTFSVTVPVLPVSVNAIVLQYQGLCRLLARLPRTTRVVVVVFDVSRIPTTSCSALVQILPWTRFGDTLRDITGLLQVSFVLQRGGGRAEDFRDHSLRGAVSGQPVMWSSQMRLTMLEMLGTLNPRSTYLYFNQNGLTDPASAHVRICCVAPDTDVWGEGTLKDFGLGGYGD